MATSDALPNFLAASHPSCLKLALPSEHRYRIHDSLPTTISLPPVKVRPHQDNKLTNRFRVDDQWKTEALFSVDDDVSRRIGDRDRTSAWFPMIRWGSVHCADVQHSISMVWWGQRTWRGQSTVHHMLTTSKYISHNIIFLLFPGRPRLLSNQAEAADMNAGGSGLLAPGSGVQGGFTH